jgi:tetratricopeptide (TPR) repeat protein
VAPLGILGMALAWTRRHDLAPLYITFAAFLASALIFFTQSRYRMPSVPILCLFAGFAIVQLWRFTRNRERRRLLIAVPVLAALILFVTLDPGNTEFFAAQNEALVAEMHLQSGNHRAAQAGYKKSIAAIRALPGGGSVAGERVRANAHMGLARTMIETGNLEEGLAQLRQATASPRSETRFGAFKMSALVLLEQGNLHAAGQAAASALDLEPDDFQMRMVRAQFLDRTGRRIEAIRELDEALKIDPANAEAARIRKALIARGSG